MAKETTKLVWDTAIYIRLSKEDGNDTSYSVYNQRELILDYIEKKGTSDVHKIKGIYIDDGQTGTDDNRQEFQKMIKDIENKKIKCVIVKDLSRPFRNYADQGYYLEYLFPCYDIRFISLQLPFLDSYLHPETVESIAVAMQGVVNDNHCRETSVKVRQVFNYKRSKGEFIGAFTPYGYKKDFKDKNRFVVDEEAAEVVRNIYDYFVFMGMSKTAIAKKLTDDGILNPTAYKRKEGMKYKNPFDKYEDGVWNATTITKILKNQSYLGHMVQGRQKVKSYKVHNRVALPQEEWFVVNNMHIPIINEKVFSKAQKLQKQRTKTVSHKKELYTFAGLLYCKDCKRAMCRKKRDKYVYYICRSYKERGETACSRHSIKESDLEGAVLAAIRLQFGFIKSVDEMIEKSSEILKSSVTLKYKKNYENEKKQTQELKRVIYLKDNLYESWKYGDISEEDYRRMKKNYENKHKILKKSVEEIKKEQQCDKIIVDIKDWCKLKETKDIERKIILNFINRIFVHEDKGITIEFKFLDKYKEVLT